MDWFNLSKIRVETGRKRVRALRLESLNEAPKLVEIPPPQPVDDECAVHLTRAALNRRDIWIMKGQYPGISLPTVLGSDGVGRLKTSVGDLASGSRVVLYPGRNWGPSETVQRSEYEILGLPRQGTFAEEICVPKETVYACPAHLNDAEAAALPLAGVTACRGLFSRGCLKAKERVLITGIGGGVASIAAQLALSANADVYVTSSTDQKLDAAMTWGCVGTANYSEASLWRDLRKQVPTGFDVIFDGAGGSQVDELLNLLSPGGRFVFYGGTRGRWPQILPQYLFFKQVSILASTMGSPKDFKALLEFVTRTKMTPVVDREYPLQKGAEAFDRVLKQAQLGKVVINCE